MTTTIIITLKTIKKEEKIKFSKTVIIYIMTIKYLTYKH